jgi:hypothetical protein
MIHSDAPERVFALLRDALALPVVWPLGDYGAFVSGAVRAGDCTLEVARFAGLDLPGTRTYGLAFAPAQPTWTMLDGLHARGIRHAPPVTHRFSEPAPVAFTNTLLGDLLDGGPETPFWLGWRFGGNTVTCRALSRLASRVAAHPRGALWLNRGLREGMAFVCEYHGASVAQEIAQRTAALVGRRGSPFGIVGLGAVEIELDDAWDTWGRLLDREGLEANPVHRFAAGPDLRFYDGRRNGLFGLTFACADIGATCRALDRAGLLDRFTRKHVRLDAARAAGLVLCFEGDSDVDLRPAS